LNEAAVWNVAAVRRSKRMVAMAGPNLILRGRSDALLVLGLLASDRRDRTGFGDALPIRLIMGGLRPGTTKPLDEAGKRSIREHWEHVHEASGQPFNMRFFNRTGFIYHTEPASKAVVFARRSGMEQSLAYLPLVQRAFYAENRDVTNEEVLADLAIKAGLDGQAFLKVFRRDHVKQETWTDFAIAQRAGITGFPTLVAEADKRPEYGIIRQGGTVNLLD